MAVGEGGNKNSGYSAALRIVKWIHRSVALD